MIKKLLSVRKINLLFLTFIIGVYTGCEEKHEKSSSKNADTLTVKQVTIPEPPPLKVVFTKEPVKSVHILSELTDRFGDAGMRQVLAINRLDTRHIVIGDTLCVPDTLPDNFLFFSPYPKHISVLDSIPKILIFSYPIQAFAAYEHGELVRWGPTSMGKKTTPTPVGLYFTNWKSKETTSTVNEEWILPWAFNIDNFNGISIHQFELPGYPASHSCARLLQSDAEWIYYWADQWILTKDGNRIRAYGTPVIIYGKYDYHSTPLWKKLAEDTDADKLNAEELIAVVKKYLPTILNRKQQRDSLIVSLRSDSLASLSNYR
jgi:hypothetical protein